MSRVAIFVDAGYLYARGSEVLCGSPQPRVAIKLNRMETLDKLQRTASEQAGETPLLRIYWYDGVVRNRPSQEQLELAHSDNVKVRLGFINNYGQQKGVDSLIVTDVVELARNHAISDAVILSGDEDIRIGVQIAQSFGVRAHLIGIGPARDSQSRFLLQECDTTIEWGEDDVRRLLTVRTTTGPDAATDVVASPSGLSGDVESAMDEAVAEVIGTTQIATDWPLDPQSGFIPPEYDGRLLASARGKIGRDLDWPEKTRLRGKFWEQVNARGETQ